MKWWRKKGKKKEEYTEVQKVVYKVIRKVYIFGTIVFFGVFTGVLMLLPQNMSNLTAIMLSCLASSILTLIFIVYFGVNELKGKLEELEGDLEDNAIKFRDENLKAIENDLKEKDEKRKVRQSKLKDLKKKLGLKNKGDDTDEEE